MVHELILLPQQTSGPSIYRNLMLAKCLMFSFSLRKQEQSISAVRQWKGYGVCLFRIFIMFSPMNVFSVGFLLIITAS